MAGSTARGLDRHVVGKIQSSGGQVTHTYMSCGGGTYLLLRRPPGSVTAFLGTSCDTYIALLRIGAEWRNGGMAEWWNGGMAEWRNGGMTEGQNGGMAEWRNGGMAEWRNGEMAEWQSGIMYGTK